MTFHGRIMNIQQNPHYSVDTYACGHRDARHAAAEIAVEADAEIERLRAALKTIEDTANDFFEDFTYALIAREALRGKREPSND